MGAGIDMSLSKLSARCQACPFVDTCDNKEMEALGYLPLPEEAARPTEKEYRSVENLWDNPKMPIGSDPASGGMVSMGGKIGIDVEGLVRTIAREIQLPERVLRGEFASPKMEEQWQKFLEINGLR